MTQPSATTALSGKECQRRCFTDKWGKRREMQKEFHPWGFTSYIAARTSFVNRGMSELVWSKTVQGKYPRWGTVRTSKVETGAFGPYPFCSTPVMKLRGINSWLEKNSMVQCCRCLWVNMQGPEDIKHLPDFHRISWIIGKDPKDHPVPTFPS